MAGDSKEAALGKGDIYDLYNGRHPWKFERIEAFCRRQNTRREDVLIILGDAGINYDGWVRDRVKKYFLEALPITLFCIHGNHEQRPQTLDTYKRRWHGGVVYYEEEYPDLLFAKDGEIFELDGWQTMVIGGRTASIRCSG